ncbi:MAG: amidase [Thermomicrobiales bacterium]
MSDDICFMKATDLAQKIRTKDLSSREVMEAFLDQIDRTNPTVNAIITMIEPEEALALADEADRKLADGEEIGKLHGLPIAHKDLAPTAGMRTTFGSPLHRDFIPEQDALIVRRLVEAGALRIGKTNVPEFGAGSHTFNTLFGPTRNPYDLSKTSGGSSGGAGAALASGMLPIADGSDHGGSLRNPGNFNNIVGFRPSAGRVPNPAAQLAWYMLAVTGPMARTVQDVAMMFSTIAGPHPRAPLSLDDPGEMFDVPLESDLSGCRIAWSPTLGGLPVDPRVTAVLEGTLSTFEDLGCDVEQADPDLSGVDKAYLDLRGWTMVAGQGENYRNNRDQLKETIIWNIEYGFDVTAEDLARAEITRSDVFQRMHRFFQDYDYLICPVNQVPPFDVETEYPTEIDGVEMEHYIAWMKSAYHISFTGLPAVSVPAGFTDDEKPLPVGIQIVAPWRQDLSALKLAHAFEGATEHWKTRPPVAG